MINPELIVIVLMFLTLVFLIRGLIRGKINFRGTTFTKIEDPVFYWLNIILGFIAVFTVLIIAYIY